MEIDEPRSEGLKKQILVVEDESLIAADIQGRLQRMGYSVPDVADSGEEALRCARSRPFDLVLMDIRLSGEMDGIATAQALKDWCHTPVVYITAHADRATIQRAKLTEPFGYVVKPVADCDLQSAVEIATHKHDMERRVRAREACLSATLHSMGEGVIATDTTGAIVFMNPVAERLTGWPAAEATGKVLPAVLTLRDESTHKPVNSPDFDRFRGEARAYTLISRTGTENPVEIDCVENRLAGEVRGSILTVRDISTRREWESRLQQSQRMEGVARLAGGLAHEFNNHLMVMLGYADELCARLSGPDRLDAEEIRRAASRATSITRNLLTLSRRDPAEFEVLTVDEVIRETQSPIRQSLGTAWNLAADLRAPADFVCYDRRQLKQVLLNLALRARDATPSGGELRFDTSTLEVEDRGLAARLYQPGRYVRLRITDSGESTDPETLSHIFDPFFTKKKSGFDAGLALSLAYSIVTRSGGYITASSDGGRGTTFEILSPCVNPLEGLPDAGGIYELMRALEAEQRQTQRAIDNLSKIATGGEEPPTVLVAGEEDAVRRLILTCLESEGYRVLEARNAGDTERLAELNPEPIQVLITGAGTADLPGTQLAERVRRFHPDVRALFVTGYSNETIEPGSRMAGHAVLHKPFAASELLLSVRRLLHHRKLGAG